MFEVLKCSLDDLENEDEDTAKEVNELHQILEEFPKDCTEYSEAVDMVEEVERTQEEWDDKKKEYRDPVCCRTWKSSRSWSTWSATW